MIYRMKLADSVDEMTFDLLEVPIEDKDIEGATDNTTIDGNVFTDYLWLKKQFVQKWSLMCKDDYTQLRGFYTRQWENAEAPTYTLFAGENRSETLTASGSAFQIQNGTQYDAPLTLTEIDGNATQDGTPTPDAPVAVQTTTGENVVKIMGKNILPLANLTFEVNLGKNLFIAPIQQGSIGGTDGAHVEPPAVNRVRTSYKMAIKPNTTYTLSAGSSVQAFVFLYQQNDTFIERIPSDWANLPYTFTTGSNAYQAEVIFRKNASNPDITPSEVQQVQLELGSTATAYEAPLELCKIGNYQDRIYKQDGKWYIEKQTGKVDAGTLTTYTWDSAKPRIYWSTGQLTAQDIQPIFPSSNTEIPLALSTAYRVGSFADIYSSTRTGFTMSPTGKNWQIVNTTGTWTDKETAFASLSGVYIYYALATPTTTEITDSTLLSQLNFIANLYGGTNNIMLVGTGAQGEIGVEYTLTYEQEQTIIPETTVRLTLTDGGVINACECRQNVQLTMRETVQ